MTIQLYRTSFPHSDGKWFPPISMPRAVSYLHLIKIHWCLEGPYPAQRMWSSHNNSVTVVSMQHSHHWLRTSFSTGFSMAQHSHCKYCKMSIGSTPETWTQTGLLQAFLFFVRYWTDTQQLQLCSQITPLGRGLCKGGGVASEYVKQSGGWGGSLIFQMEWKVSHQQIISQTNYD